MLRIEYDEARHAKLHDMVLDAQKRINASMQDAFAHMKPLFISSVSNALASAEPLRTGREYLLFINGMRKKHIASRYGEIPAPITGRLADSVAVGYAGNELYVVETAPYAKFLEGRQAEGTVRYRPHLARLCNTRNLQFRNVLLQKMHKHIQGKV